MLADEQMRPEYIAILRRMTWDEKWIMIHKLYRDDRNLRLADMRAQHPDWSEEQVKREVNCIILSMPEG